MTILSSCREWNLSTWLVNDLFVTLGWSGGERRGKITTVILSSPKLLSFRQLWSLMTMMPRERMWEGRRKKVYGRMGRRGDPFNRKQVGREKEERMDDKKRQKGNEDCFQQWITYSTPHWNILSSLSLRFPDKIPFLFSISLLFLSHLIIILSFLYHLPESWWPDVPFGWLFSKERRQKQQQQKPSHSLIWIFSFLFSLRFSSSWHLVSSSHPIVTGHDDVGYQ